MKTVQSSAVFQPKQWAEKGSREDNRKQDPTRTCAQSGVKIEHCSRCPYLTKGTPDAIVIENPEAGWNRLRDRILRDISHEDVVLPQQLKIILGGIQHLKRLNVAEYERIGGAGGVEALYVQQQISGTARKVGLEPGQVRAMLASGTDRPS